MSRLSRNMPPKAVDNCKKKSDDPAPSLADNRAEKLSNLEILRSAVPYGDRRRDDTAKPK
jgi:hypothetical protein